MLILVVVLAVAAVLFVAAAVVTNDRDLLVDVAPDRADLALPVGRLVPADVAGVRFGLALRGYRMAEVDTVLDRVQAALAERDARIGELEVALAAIVAPVVREAEEQALSLLAETETETETATVPEPPAPEPLPQPEPEPQPEPVPPPAPQPTPHPEPAPTPDPFPAPGPLPLPDPLPLPHPLETRWTEPPAVPGLTSPFPVAATPAVTYHVDVPHTAGADADLADADLSDVAFPDVAAPEESPAGLPDAVPCEQDRSRPGGAAVER